MAAIQFQDPAGGIIQKVAVMGNGNHGPRVFDQEAFQPGNTLGIEVVGGFIQQQHVRVGEQQLAKCHAAAFPAGKLADVSVP